MEKHSSVNIYDIAKMANTSPRTVTRAFQKDSPIKAETRQRILEIAEQVGYRPNAAAGRIRGKALIIGAVIMDQVEAFTVEIVRGLEAAQDNLKDLKTQVLIRICKTIEESNAVICEFVGMNVDGIVTTGGHFISPRTEALLEEKKIPIVTEWWERHAFPLVSHVSVNAELKGKLAASMLALLCPGGNICIFTGDNSMHHQLILNGFMKEAVNNGLHITQICEAQELPSLVETHAENLLEKKIPCDGVFFASANSVAAIEVFQKHNFHPVIIGSDMFPQMADYLRTGVVAATIFQNPEKQGRMSVMTLYQYLTGNDDYPKKLLITPQIVLKCSVDIFEQRTQHEA